MVILLKVVQVILVLSLLVVVHEFGHYIFAKMFGTRVEKFYMFFNPTFSIVRVKRFGGRFHVKFFAKNVPSADPSTDLSTLADDDWNKYPDNTEYGIGWLPFGGYCAIGGMIDETKSADALSAEPQPWELRTKPAWQRFLVMFGGVLFNMILAVILYAAVLHHWGEEYLENRNAVYGVAVNDLAYEVGFRDGDRILDFDGKEIDNFNNLQLDMVCSRAAVAHVLRKGDTVTVNIDPVYLPAMLNSAGMFSLAYPFVVKDVQENSINAGCDLRPGDKVTAVNGEEMNLVQVVQRELKNHKGDSIVATVQREAAMVDVPLAVDTAGKIGVMLDVDLAKFFTVTTREFSVLESLPAGAVKAWNYIKNYVQQLGLIFSPKTKAYKSVGSFISIGRIFPDTWDWFRFWSLAAMLSIMLAVLNIIPIPGLDGGHILFILVEMITGRKPSDKFLEVAQTIGMILLLALMVLAFGNDIRSLF